MKTKCIIVDDEPLAIEVIEAHLSHLSSIEIVARCRNAVEAVDILKNESVDLMFLDIQMPHITGIDFLKSLSYPPKVIFTTAYREYALEGFELDVVDYLLKPISFERFLKAINKYYELTRQHLPQLNGNEQVTESKKYLYVKADKKNNKIYFTDMQFIESLKDYIIIHTSSRKVITKIPISRFEQQLPDSEFIRIHRSYIVALDKIEAFNSEIVEVAGKELPIGRNYRSVVLSTLKPVD